MRGTALGTLIVALFGLSSAARAADAPVTFTKDVAPILYKSCVECHRPTMFAPMSSDPPPRFSSSGTSSRPRSG